MRAYRCRFSGSVLLCSVLLCSAPISTVLCIPLNTSHNIAPHRVPSLPGKRAKKMHHHFHCRRKGNRNGKRRRRSESFVPSARADILQARSERPGLQLAERKGDLPPPRRSRGDKSQDRGPVAWKRQKGHLPRRACGREGSSGELGAALYGIEIQLDLELISNNVLKVVLQVPSALP